MCHAPITRRHIDVTLSSPALLRLHYSHMYIVLDFGKQNVLLIQPCQAGSIWQPPMRLPARRGNEPGVPVVPIDSCISDLRAVQHENRTHFLRLVSRELHRPAFGQHLDVDLAWPGERSRNREQRSAFDRQATGRLGDGIREVGDLDIIRAGRQAVRTEQPCRGSSDNR